MNETTNPCQHVVMHSQSMVYMPGYLLWAQRVMRGGTKKEKQVMRDVFLSMGLGPNTVEALLLGLLKTTEDREQGTVSFWVEDPTF